jgi:P-type Cu+ transporter
VNLAAETATVSYDPETVRPDQLTTAIAAAGYTGTLRVTEQTGPATAATAQPADDREARRDAEIADLKRKWQVALTAGLLLMVLMYPWTG